MGDINNIVEITPDGKQEVVPGKEPLKKDPKKSKLRDKWNRLKKALDHATAFLDLKEAQSDDEEEPEMQSETSEEAADVPIIPGDEEPSDGSVAENGIPADDGGLPDPTDPATENTEPAEEPAEEPDPDELADALRQEGYSEQEIAYIVHGHHSPPVDLTSQAKAEATTAMSSVDVDNAKAKAALERELAQKRAELEHAHKQKVSEHELEHKRRMSDLEYESSRASVPDPQLDKEHRKRMLDLEYEAAKAQMPDGSADKEANKQIKQLEVEQKKLELEARKQQLQLEMEFKKKEYELKLKQMEAQIKQQAKMKDEILREKHKHKLAEAKKPPVKKPLKKSHEEGEYEQEDGSDAEEV